MSDVKELLELADAICPPLDLVNYPQTQMRWGKEYNLLDTYNLIRDLVSHIKSAGWQDIATAPRDGAILGCMPGPSIDIITWDNEVKGWLDYYYKQIVLPYFGWQPLPSPPADNKEQS